MSIISLELWNSCAVLLYTSVQNGVQCSILQCSAVQCSVVQASDHIGQNNSIKPWWRESPLLHSIVFLHCTVLHCISLHCTSLHCTALDCTIMHFTPQHYTALYCSALYYTASHCTALYCTVSLWPNKFFASRSDYCSTRPIYRFSLLASFLGHIFHPVLLSLLTQSRLSLPFWKELKIDNYRYRKKPAAQAADADPSPLKLYQ